MTTHRPRVRSTLIRALIITVVAAAIVVAYRTWDYVEARRLERQLAAIEGGGESLTRYNLSRPLRLPESADNAERYYVAAAELLESSQFGPALKAMAALRRSEPAPAPDAAQWAVVREWIHSNTLALDLLATAARHEWGPGSPHRVGESGYAPVFGFVRLAELVAARGFDLARSGSAEPAAAVLVNGWRMMRRAQDPFFSTWSAVLSRSLVLGVQSVLGSGAQTDETLRRLQTEIVGLDRADALERALIAERTRGWELMWQPLLPSRWGWNRWFRPGRLTPPIVEFIVRPVIRRRATEYLQLMEEAIATTRRPWPENLGTLEKMERTLEEFPRGSRSWVLPRPEWLVKDSLRHVQGFAHALAMNRAAATAVMIERYRLAHAGALPDTLLALVPAYTAAMPRDPMTRAELLYRRSAGEYVIYSVGRNRRDDGGELVVTTRWSTKEGRDWGIRVRISARRP